MIVKHEKEIQPADLSHEHDLKGVELLPLVTEQDGAKHFSMRLFRVSPDGHTPFHSHPWEHEVYVLQGRGTLVGEAEEHALEPGSAVLVPEGEKHRFQAGGEGLMFLCCVPQLKDPP